MPHCKAHLCCSAPPPLEFRAILLTLLYVLYRSFWLRFFVYFPYEIAFSESKHLKEYNFTKDHIFQIHYPSIVSLKFNFFDLLQIFWVCWGNGNEFHGQHQPTWHKGQKPPQQLFKKERKRRKEDAGTFAIHKHKAAGWGQPVVLRTLGSVKPFAQNTLLFCPSCLC